MTNFLTAWENHDFQENHETNNHFTYCDAFIDKLRKICSNINTKYLVKQGAVITKISKKNYQNTQDSVTFNIYYSLKNQEHWMQINCYSSEDLEKHQIPDSISFI